MVLTKDRKYAVQLTEPAAVPEPVGAAEPGRTAEPSGPVQRQTQLTDQEERHNRRLQGDQPGAGAGHQWQGARNIPEEDRRQVRAEGR